MSQWTHSRTADGWRLTAHADKRSKERCLNLNALDLVIAYGREKRVKGASRWFLDKAARKRIRQELGGDVYRRLGRCLSAVVVQADDGDLITAYRREPRRRLSKCNP